MVVIFNARIPFVLRILPLLRQSVYRALRQAQYNIYRDAQYRLREKSSKQASTQEGRREKGVSLYEKHPAMRSLQRRICYTMDFWHPNPKVIYKKTSPVGRYKKKTAIF